MPAIFYVSYAALWILLLVLSVLVLLIYRHFGLMSLGTEAGVQRDGLAVGEVAPPVKGVTAQGEQVEWTPASDCSHLLMFVSPSCEPCARILPSVLRLAVTISNIEIILVVDGEHERVIRLVERFQPPASVLCLAENRNGLIHAYQVRVTPFAFMIGKDRRIHAKGLCDSIAKLQYLLAAGALEIPDNMEAISQDLG